VLTTPAPIQYIATTDDDIAQLRAEIFRGQLDDSVLCGLPYYKIGRRRLFDIVAVRHWVTTRQEVKNAEPRRRGRPRRTAR
jgi:hypothetical protein